MREDRLHRIEDRTGEGTALRGGAKSKEVMDIVAGERGKRVLAPFIPLDMDPQLAEDIAEVRVVRTGKRMPLSSRGVPYLLYCGFDRLFP